MEFALLGLILLGIPFVLPIVSWVSGRRTRQRVTALETVVLQQTDEIRRLTARLRRIERVGGAEPTGTAIEPAAAEPAGRVPAAAAPVREEAVEPPAAWPAEQPTAVPVEPPVALPAEPPAALPVEPPAALPVEPPAVLPGEPAPEPSAPEPLPAAPPRPASEPVPTEAAVPPVRPPRARPPSPPPAAAPAFDWESIIGVKLFAAIAGIALVFAAVLFLRYSIDQGWLQPPVRVAIGVLVALALLVLCELKSARDYPATANALDGAAIAILFATFYAAHALWNLIPATATFALLAVVTALAVLLSIRRESLFIAVLGLLGGFATPALLSTGENRPIPLFAYLLLLNLGLAWVAYRQVWPVLTWLTLGLTTAYQLIWVLRFLDESSVSLAMGIFLMFPLAAAVGLMLGGPRPGGGADGSRSFERTAMLSAGVPLIFAAYLASVPAYGAHDWLLLGLLLLVDAGLFAIAVVRRLPLLHAVGALATVIVLAVWLATSYVVGHGWAPALACTGAFVVFYLAAPIVGRWFHRPFEAATARTSLAAPLLFFVFPVLAAIEPAVSRPLMLFGTLLALLVFTAWRATVESAGRLYFIASFFAIATQAVWSARYLTDLRLREAVAIYTIFGLVSMATPVF